MKNVILKVIASGAALGIAGFVTSRVVKSRMDKKNWRERSALWLHSGAADVAKVILTADGKRQVKEWYLALKELTKEEQIVASIDSAIFHICRTAWITEVMDRVLSR